MDNRNKRGSNYTLVEKETLLSILQQYKQIIESKETNAIFNKKKRETWERIAERYNAQAITGPRTWQQLRHLYDNMKQKLRKDIAKENRNRYDTLTTEIEKRKSETSQIEIMQIKKKAMDDKKELLKTGGGSYKSNLTDTDAQVLALIAPQVVPLPNPYDDAAAYFGDDEINITEETPMEISTIQEIDCYCEQAVVVNKNIAVNNCNKENYSNAGGSKEKAANKRKENLSVKAKYFNLKLQNAKLERKFLILKNKREAKLHNLKLQL